jgi:hypothetical protein
MKKLISLALLSASFVVLEACGSGSGDPSRVTASSVQATAHPLVAQYSVTASKAGTAAIQFGPTTSYGLTTSWQALEPGTPANFLVAGMKPNTLYHLRAVVGDSGGTQHYDSDHTFTTAAVDPARVPAIQVTTTPGMTPASGVELISLNPGPGNQLMILAVDPEGNLIWYYDFAQSLGIPEAVKLLPNGHILAIIDPPPAVSGRSLLQEIDLAGNLVHQLDSSQLQQELTNAGYNIQVYFTDHDFVLLPNGHLLFIVTDTRVFTDLPGYPGPTKVLGNAIVDLDPNYKVAWVWDAFDHLDINRHPMGFPQWIHANALVYTPDDGNLLLSMRHQSWVTKIDYENGNGTGDVLWKLGYQGDFTLTSGDDSAWFAAQHDANLASSKGTGDFPLAVFDNGDDRVIDGTLMQCGSVLPPLPNCYSGAAIFDVNEKAMTATREWFYQVPYSFWGGVTQVLPSGNVFVDEASPADLNNQSMRALEVTQTANPQVLWQMQITNQSSYRTIHLPSLYPGVQW